jgi:hypothetical protein
VLFAKYNFIDQAKEDELGRACSTHGEKMKAYRFLAGKPEEKRTLGGLTHR